MSVYLFPALVAIQVISALSIIGLVLLQQGKGADMGSSFGSGSAGSLFGSAGSANFFSRLTKWAAVIFFASTLGLAVVSSQSSRYEPTDAGSVMENFTAIPTTDSAVPVAPVPSATPSAPAAATPSVEPAQPSSAEVPSAPALIPAETPAVEVAPTTEDTPATETNTTPEGQ
ncbi:preprotein translocase subunit SecG [Pelistega ratti]|uniref:preprotein translocase subunit SecG n=1 Tax=Pelistega ratti TaxID=2652177 RepID=UPI00135AFB20|nr:preprotein translocase subunit SecG [Pelistega ratti]